MIKAILFDMDGVLVDAADWHFEAFNKALSLFGYPLDKKFHDENYNGLPTTVKLKKFSAITKLPYSLHCFINEMKQSYTKEILNEKCKPNPRISQLLEDLSNQGYSLAVCSNSNRTTVDQVLELMHIRSYFNVVLSTNDVTKTKPDPEIYNRAMELLSFKPEECLIIEDSKPGIDSAENSDAYLLEVSNPNEVSLKKIQDKIQTIDGTKRSSISKYKKSETIEIIIPMAGLGTRFQAAGFKEPKPLIPVLNKPMIQWVVENIRPKNYRSHFTFICNEEHLKTLDVESLLRKIEPTCNIVTVKETTQGAACTVLLANDRLLSSRPTLVANSDQWVDFDIDRFIEDALKKESDGSILSFQASDKKWSFAKLDSKHDRVLEVAEKNPISSNATVGIYYFKHAYDLAAGIKSMIQKNIRTNGEFYLCPVYNELIQAGKIIRVYEISHDQMHGLGTPEDLQVFLEKNS